MLEKAEKNNIEPLQRSEREDLSREVHGYFQPITSIGACSNEVPSTLDFGTGSDLYRNTSNSGLDDVAAKSRLSQLSDQQVLISQIHRDNLEETLSQTLARLHPLDAPAGSRPGVDYFSVSDFVARKGVQDAAAASPHLAATLQELRECKWSKDIHVWKRHPLEFTDYSAENSRLEIDSSASYKRQIETLAHEGYHATHQDLDKLYGGSSPLDENKYVDVKLHQEVGAFLREIQVNNELRKNRPDLGGEPIVFMWVDPKNPKGEPIKQVMNELLVYRSGQFDEKASFDAIEKFLRHHLGAVGDGSGQGYKRDEQGNLSTKDYVANAKSGFTEYSKPANFKASKDHLKQEHYI
ncbi:MAG: hypothetical protein JST89_09580 [Cyanobacteria bacterium SZAS-4]|nr:hypothetical protein [Cyanobacteria bacterium SZAS-4]